MGKYKNQEDLIKFAEASLTMGCRRLCWRIPEDMEIQKGDILIVEVITGDILALAKATGKTFYMSQDEFEENICPYFYSALKNLGQITAEGLRK